jgi:hypothetical protein
VRIFLAFALGLSLGIAWYAWGQAPDACEKLRAPYERLLSHLRSQRDALEWQLSQALATAAGAPSPPTAPQSPAAEAKP